MTALAPNENWECVLHSMVSGTSFLSLELQATEAIKWISGFDLGFTPGTHTVRRSLLRLQQGNCNGS